MIQIDPKTIDFETAREIQSEVQFNPMYSQLERSEISSSATLLIQFIIQTCKVAVGISFYGYSESSIRSKMEKRQMDLRQIAAAEAMKENAQTVLKAMNGIDLDNSQEMVSSQELSQVPQIQVSFRNSDYLNQSKNQSQRFRGLNSTVNGHRRIKSMFQQRAVLKKEGSYLQPKHLILTDFKVLKPSLKVPPSIPVFNLHETLPKNILQDNQDAIEVPDIDLYNLKDVTLAKYLKDPKDTQLESYDYVFSEEDIKAKMNQVPGQLEDAVKYAFEKDPQKQPTSVLFKLSSMMKDARLKQQDNIEKMVASVPSRRVVFKK